MSKKKITENQLLYKKEINRIKRAIKRLSVKGINVNYSVPKQPKRVTKQAIAKLKKVTPSFLRGETKENEKKRFEIYKGETDENKHIRSKNDDKKSATTKKDFQIESIEHKESNKKAPLKIHQEFLKQKRRLKRFIKNAEKRGFKFSSELIDIIKNAKDEDFYTLEQLKPKGLYELSEWVDPVTGEKWSGTEGRHIENTRRAKKSAETRRNKKVDEIYSTSAITKIKGLLEEFDNSFALLWYRIYNNEGYHAPETMTNIWDDTIFEYTQSNNLKMLEEYAEQHFAEIQHCIDVVYWASKQDMTGSWQKFNSELLMLLRVGEMPSESELRMYGDTQSWYEIMELSDLIED